MQEKLDYTQQKLESTKNEYKKTLKSQLDKLERILKNRKWHNPTLKAISDFTTSVNKHYLENELDRIQFQEKYTESFYKYLTQNLYKIDDEIFNIIYTGNTNTNNLDDLSKKLSKATFDGQYLPGIMLYIGLAILMSILILLTYSSPINLYTTLGIFGYLFLTVTCVAVFAIIPNQPSNLLTKAKNAIHAELELESTLNKLEKTEKSDIFKSTIENASSMSAKECTYFAKIAASDQKVTSKSVLFFHPERWFESKDKSAQREKIEIELISMKNP